MTSRPCRRGFTAIEMSMVVTVIAILALLIIPLFQRQTEEARISAAEGDIRELAIAMQMVHAHTSLYFPLSVLDNTTNFTTTNISAVYDVPVVTWNDTRTTAERLALANLWEGPYISFRRSITAGLLPTTYFRTGSGADGPINQEMDSSVSGSIDSNANFTQDLVPLDPWGNPYLFYGPDYYHLPNGTGGGVLTQETRFGNTLFLSLGPNGVPGDVTTPSLPRDLYRERGIVGTGDDIFRIM